MTNKATFRDCGLRAAEILEELSEDGYPPDLQWMISLALVCRIIVREATDGRDLRKALRASRGIIERESKFCFERRGR